MGDGKVKKASVKPKILHFSPVRKQEEIVRLHCQSLEDLVVQEFDVTFSFFDDNKSEESKEVLREFQKSNTKTLIFSENDLTLDEDYLGNDRWSLELYARIIQIKDFIIDYFEKSDYDYLFLTDSDLILHPLTLQNLYNSNKDFVSEVFWTDFDGRPTYYPNGWYDQINGYKNADQVIEMRDTPLLEVHYTGACTLLSREIIEAGVRFQKIGNLARIYRGEDKHFCIRAHVLGFKIFLNTESPAFHIYTDDLILVGEKYQKEGYDINFFKKEWLNDEWELKIRNHYEKKSNLFKNLKKMLKSILT